MFTSPSRMACAAAWTRFSRCNFSRMLWTWFLTVPSTINRRPAISALLKPPATNWSISSSREVRSQATFSAGSRQGRWRISVSSFPATAGESGVSPRNTPRTRSNSSSGRRSFSRYPSAPLLIASNRSSSSSEIVRATTLISGHSLLIRRVASAPPQTGIWMSISTTSGLADRTCSTAFTPSEASPTTSKPSSSSRRARSPFRNRSWSSTRRIRTGAIVLSLHYREIDPHSCPVAGAGLYLEAPAHPFHTFSHGAHAEPGHFVGQDRRIEAAALVFDAYADFVRPAGDPYAGFARPCVLADVGKRLLDDPDQLHLRLGRELRLNVSFDLN